MNKKLLMFGIVGMLSVMLVSAALVTYFSQVEQTIDVKSPIIVEGNEPLEITGNATEVVIGKAITITNRLANPIDITISGDDSEEGIEISYLSELELTKKDTSTWEVIDDKVTITYTKVGKTFEYLGVPTDYTLIYYKDSVIGLNERLDNPKPAIKIVSNIGSLPMNDDANNNADYSEAPDYYAHKTGAKIWAVPIAAISGNILDWSQMDNFYYESDLITSTNSDEVILEGFETITIYPRYDINRYATGSINVITTIA